ncbi:hypothetical protein WI72_30185 [Burkholderia ubonensis]|nr:hypothetical protein WI72_30185 [Burkholderia ubonensis]KVD97230.1 hypothetical protein WI90_31555 [Burkholderia ubonensis]
MSLRLPGHEYIAAPGDGFDQFSTSAKDFAQGGDVHLEIVLFHEDVRPYLFYDVELRHFLAVRVEEDFKYVKRLSADFYRNAILFYMTLRKVDLQIADLDHGLTPLAFDNRFNEGCSL